MVKSPPRSSLCLTLWEMLARPSPLVFVEPLQGSNLTTSTRYMYSANVFYVHLHASTVSNRNKYGSYTMWYNYGVHFVYVYKVTINSNVCVCSLLMLFCA